MFSVEERLRAVEYPGRGLVIGRTAAGALIEIYFICGRSRASKDRRAEIDEGRIFVASSSETAAHDPLRHYCAMLQTNTRSLIGNGSHVSEMAATLEQGGDFLKAWRRQRVEPDDLATPRILASTWTGGVVLASVRKSESGIDEHIVVAVEDLPPGFGYLLHTYGGLKSGPKTDAEPHGVQLRGDLDDVAAECWRSLRSDVRVLLVGRSFSSPSDSSPIVFQA